MSGETVWLLIGLGAALSFVLWARRRRSEVRQLSTTYGGGPAEEPCWTEQISTDGRFSYGRCGCYHANLADMESRARRGEFDTPA